MQLKVSARLCDQRLGALELRGSHEALAHVGCVAAADSGHGTPKEVFVLLNSVYQGLLRFTDLAR